MERRFRPAAERARITDGASCRDPDPVRAAPHNNARNGRNDVTGLAHPTLGLRELSPVDEVPGARDPSLIELDELRGCPLRRRCYDSLRQGRGLGAGKLQVDG